MRRTLAFISGFALVITALALPAIADNDENTVDWADRYGGWDDGVETLKCDPVDYGQDSAAALLGDDTSGFYLKWIYTENTATGVKLHGPWGAEPMFQNPPNAQGRGGSAWMLVTKLYDFEDIKDVFVSYEEGDGSGNLNISNGCDKAKVTVEKLTVDARPGTFDFETNLNGNFSLSHGQSVTFWVPAGDDYFVTEEVPENWNLIDRIFPTEGNVVGSTGDTGNTVFIEVTGYADATITFVNEELTGAILIEKSYTVEPTTGRATFELWNTAEGETEAIKGDTKIGDFQNYPFDYPDPDVYCIEDLSLGDYWIVENVPDGFIDEGIAGTGFISVLEPGTCAEGFELVEIENQASPIALDVRKFKLDFDDELGFVTTDTALKGWTFQLYAEANVNVPFLERAVTDADGVAQFDRPLAIGETYTVCEIAAPRPGGGLIGRDGTYWSLPYRALGDEVGSEVEPWGGILGRCSTITPELGDEDVVLDFYNAPKADISVGFTDVTGYTTATLACYDADGTLVGESTTGSLDVSELVLGDYTCEVKLRNGGDGS